VPPRCPRTPLSSHRSPTPALREPNVGHGDNPPRGARDRLVMRSSAAWADDTTNEPIQQPSTATRPDNNKYELLSTRALSWDSRRTLSSASSSGRRGRRFKSGHPDQLIGHSPTVGRGLLSLGGFDRVRGPVPDHRGTGCDARRGAGLVAIGAVGVRRHMRRLWGRSAQDSMVRTARTASRPTSPRAYPVVRWEAMAPV
jgi:hypothetical protein